MKSLIKAKEVLSLIASEPGIGLPQIARKLGMPKSTAYRILRALSLAGFVLELDDKHRYGLGPLINDLTSGHSRRAKLIRVARPLMIRLRDQCNETVALHLLQGGSWVVIDQVESSQQIRRTITNLGTPLALHAGAPGKLFLALMSERDREAYLATEPLKRFTPNTLTDRGKLHRELAMIVRRGYSKSVEEVVQGVSSLAMPIRSSDGSVVAAIGVSGPIARFTPKKASSILSALTRTVEEARRALLAEDRG
ncbi:MAG: IclR family transcriptional regulator [Burkholderiales bacterium]